MEIAICGTGPSLREIPMSFRGEIWGVNDIYKLIRRLKMSRLFFMDTLDQKHKSTPDFAERLNGLKIPIITQKHYPEIPLSEEYPLKQVIEKTKCDYFANTICYEIAYAIWRGDVEKINFYGVDFKGHPTYEKFRAGTEFWMGLAKG